MEEAQIRFGALPSTDFKLWLTAPIDVHSQILRRSKVFEAMMSERWSMEEQNEIRVTTSHNCDDYLKCIRSMYGEPVHFSNVDECLGILCVAAELLVDDCINECMQYLQGIRWSAEQETQIRDVVSCLGLKPIPDLAARLGMEDRNPRNPRNFLEKIFKLMVSYIKHDWFNLMESRKTLEKYIVGELGENTSRDVVNVCRTVLLPEFKASIDSHDFSTVMRLFKLIRHCERSVLRSAFNAFCEDPEFIDYVKENCWFAEDKRVVLCITVWFTQAIGEGKIIISGASRVSFLITGLPIMGEMCKYGNNSIRTLLDKAVLAVVETLPPEDKKSICLAWAEIYRLNKIDIPTPLQTFLSVLHAKAPVGLQLLLKLSV